MPSWGLGSARGPTSGRSRQSDHRAPTSQARFRPTNRVVEGDVIQPANLGEELDPGLMLKAETESQTLLSARATFAALGILSMSQTVEEPGSRSLEDCHEPL